MTGDRLISAEYRAQQAALHASNSDYGAASTIFAPMVAKIVQENGIGRVLDYGAGKGRLAEALAGDLKAPVAVTPYEPAIAAWASTPMPHDMVVCLDVLEHIEPDCLDAVLDDLRRLTLRIGFFTVHTGPALKMLPDGRNAHLIQQPPRWWLPKFLERFELLAFSRFDSGFWILIEPRRA